MNNPSRKDIIKKVLLSFTFLFLVAAFVYAAGPFTPGFTLDPDCNPGDVDCIVVAPSGSSLDGFTTLTGTALGKNAGDVFVSGNYSTMIGQNAGEVFNNEGGTFVGFNSGYQTTGMRNTFFGEQSGAAITTGKYNTAVGANANFSNGTLSNSISIGYGASADMDSQFALPDTVVNLKIAGVRYIFPSNQGTVDQVLTNDGNGNLSWETPVDTDTDTNIYNTNGTLTGTRTIASGGNSLTFDGTGDIVFDDSGLLTSVGLTSTGAFDQTGTSAFTGGITLRSGNSFTFNNTANTFGTSFVAGNNTSNLTYTLPITAPTAGQFLSSTAGGVLSWASSSGWGLTGNSGTSPNINFIGTTDAQDLVFRVNNTQVGRITQPSGVSGTAQQILFGPSAGQSASSAPFAVFIGSGAGVQATSARESNFLGASAGQQATSARNSNFLGSSVGVSATNASYSNFLGFSAGYQATNASYSNFLGASAGSGATSAAYSTLIGYRAGKAFTSNNIGANNIIIGKNISLPDTTANAINIGGVLFGTGTYTTLSADPSIAPVSGGKIGIGVVTPLDTLQVAGDIRTGTTGSNGCIKDFAGTGIVGTCSSDEDLKQDIQDLPELSDKFSQVRFVTYKWNDTAKEIYSNNTDVTNTGTIAQSVESQFPELVSRDDKGYRVVNYSGLLMYGMEAIKEVVSLADSFREKLVSWFADAANGIGDLFVKRVRTETLCVGTPGNETCITKEQLDNILGGQSTPSSFGGGGGSSPDPEPVPDPTPTLDPEPVVDGNPDPAPDPEPAPDPTPAPDPAPESTPE